MPHSVLYFVVTNLLEQPYRQLAIGRNAEWDVKHAQGEGETRKNGCVNDWVQGHKTIEYERIEQFIISC